MKTPKAKSSAITKAATAKAKAAATQIPYATSMAHFDHNANTEARAEAAVQAVLAGMQTSAPGSAGNPWQVLIGDTVE